jgi:hypothetical protein
VGLGATRDDVLQFEELGATFQIFDLGLNIAVSDSVRVCGSAELFQWLFGHGRLGAEGPADHGTFRVARLDAGVCFDGTSSGVGMIRLSYDADGTILLGENGKPVVRDGITRAQEGSNGYSREALRLDWQKVMGHGVNVGLEYRFNHSVVGSRSEEGLETVRRIDDSYLGVRAYGSW